MDWDSVSFVMSGKLRFRILIELKNSHKTPSDLATLFKVPISHISKTIKELEEKDLVKCLTPERRKMKLYMITKKGIEILNEINKITSKTSK